MGALLHGGTCPGLEGVEPGPLACPTMAKERHYYGHAWRVARAAVLAESTVCGICGREGSTTVDHIIPVSRGGAPYDRANLQPAHERCNYRKGARLRREPMRRSREW